jgi:two-component system, NtrC family, response regulator AtoC
VAHDPAMAIATAVIADDEILNRELLTEMLPRLGVSVRSAKDGVQALKLLEAEPADLLITDIRMPGMGGLKLLLKSKEKWPEMPVVMMTAFASVESAVESMRQGAYDYLMKPFHLEQVEALLLRLNERGQLLREVKVLRAETTARLAGRKMLGQSPAMAKVTDIIGRAARSAATVLIRGESGTGKELVARALHQDSPRAAGPFITVNCAALTETLLTSELFGHEKGSFTGADDQRIGRFELAAGGTILLDEISEISPELQAKLLRVLEERCVERVGGNRPIPVDVRILATTNRDLLAYARSGRFREDLYYRLNVVPIDMPALRDRQDDIPVLIAHYLAVFGKDQGVKAKMEPAAIELLAAYRWPGNVRELVNIIERLVVLCGSGTITAAQVRDCLPELRHAGDSGWPVDLSLDGIGRRHAAEVLAATGGDRGAAAARLGIGPGHLMALLPP